MIFHGEILQFIKRKLYKIIRDSDVVLKTAILFYHCANK